MKKGVIIALLVAGITAPCATAQTLVEPPVDGWSWVERLIPSSITSTGKPYFGYLTDDKYDVYDSDLQLVKSFGQSAINEIGDIIFARYYDLNQPLSGHYCRVDELVCSQTLFNNDNKFEFIRKTDSGIDIVSEDGSVLYTFDGNYTSSVYLYRFGEYIYVELENRIYAGIDEYGDPVYDYNDVYYRIDTPTQSVAEVDATIAMKIFPTIATKYEYITIDLDENGHQKVLSVQNAMGQTIYRINIEQGQKRVVISTRELSGGMNYISIRDKKYQTTNKVIVR